MPYVSSSLFLKLGLPSAVISIALACSRPSAEAFTLSGASWPAGSQVIMQLGLGDLDHPLIDRNTSWNDAIAPGFSFWNQRMLRLQFISRPGPAAPASSGDGVNSVVFAPDVFGQGFGAESLAVTITRRQGTVLQEADIIYNRAQFFDSYRGLLRVAPNNSALPDIRRVFLHELGHSLGLEHVPGDAIMNAFISDLELLAPDDIAGGQAIYGEPPPVITSPLIASGVSAQPFVYQFNATGAASLAVSNLPVGLVFDPSRQAIIGNPSAPGSYQVQLTAPNAIGTTIATLNLVVQPAPAGPVIVSSTSATGRTGRRFTFQVFITGGTSAARLSATNLPPGLSVDPVTGLISGNPSQDGSFAVGLTVTDGAATTTGTLQLSFSSDPALPVIISPNSASLTAGQPFLYTILAPAVTRPGDLTTFRLEGTLPSGLSFDPLTGIITGIFTGPNAADRAESPAPRLTGGVISNVQLFATNSVGTTTIPLTFFLRPSGVANISTRLSVGLDPNALIGGFIITGNAPKKVIVRAIAPSLSVNGAPLPGTLPDPVLELVGNGVSLNNDDWRAAQEQDILDSTVAPTNNRESAIVAVLNPGGYTAIVRGKNGATGIGLVEVFDLGTASLEVTSSANLANISTRGFVRAGDDVMIGGFIITGATTRVIVRAIGPDLSARGVPGALQDTTLEVRDGAGTLVASNDNWESDQRQQIIATTIPPADPRESAIVATLLPGSYTAIVRGKDGSTGVALVEVYGLP